MFLTVVSGQRRRPPNFGHPAALTIVLLLCWTMSTCHGGGSSAGTGRSLCNDRQFFCPSKARCVARRFRCVTGQRPATGGHCPLQRDCEPVQLEETQSGRLERPSNWLAPIDSRPGRFHIWTAFSPIYRSGSRSRRQTIGKMIGTLFNDPWQHSFVQYRGFVYEFGSYGAKELDVNDVNYKYNTEPSFDWRRTGVSSCVRKHLRRFMKSWMRHRGQYSWHSNNCHSFSRSMTAYLKADCVGRPDFYFQKS